jgi:uncharacterized protein (TIGR03067 family)
MHFAVTLLVSFGSLALGADQPADDAKKLEGHWAVVWRAYDGPRSDDVNQYLTAQEYMVSIKGRAFAIRRARDGYLAEVPLTLKVDGSKNPKEVDFADKKGRLVYEGIYRIKGDQLKLCYGPPGQRPKKFASPKGSGVWLVSLKRPSAFWDAVAPKELQAKFEPLLKPNASALSGVTPGEPFTITKDVTFAGVRQSEQRMAEVLGRLQADLLRAAKASGAEVHGDVRETKTKGLLRQFEFDYRQGKTAGRVRGEIKPGQMEGCWDLQCLVGELLVRTR